MSSNILVTMLVTDNIMSYGKYSILINKTYCQKNNYDFFVCNKILDTEKHPAWSKILLLEKCLDMNYEYIFFIDADACFVNQNIKIEKFLNEKSITIANQNINENDPKGENSGVILLKNNNISREFLIDCFSIYEQCKNSCVWDQEAIGIMLGNKYKKHYHRVTCKEFNAYHGDFARSTNLTHCFYEDGDYIMHMLRTSSEYKINEFKKICSKLNIKIDNI